LGFHVIFNHGNSEFGKDYILIAEKYSNNAKEVIQRGIDQYKFSNIIFLSKSEFEHLS
jgi:hypothetical protein